MSKIGQWIIESEEEGSIYYDERNNRYKDRECPAPRGEEKGGGNREEEIIGSHAFDIRQAVKGRVGSVKEGERDFDISIGGNETRVVNGNFNLNVIKDYTI